MSTACIGGVLSWIAAYVVPSLGEVPSHLGSFDSHLTGQLRPAAQRSGSFRRHDHELHVPDNEGIQLACRGLGLVQRHDHELHAHGSDCIQPADRRLGHVQRRDHEPHPYHNAFLFNQPMGNSEISSFMIMIQMFPNSPLF